MVQTSLSIPLATSTSPALPDGVQLRRFADGDLEAAEILTREMQWPHRIED